MHEDRDGEAAEGGAAQFLGEQGGCARVQRAAAELLRIAQPQEAEPAHLAQHFARHESLLFPRMRLRHDFFFDEAPDGLAQ